MLEEVKHPEKQLKSFTNVPQVNNMDLRLGVIYSYAMDTSNILGYRIIWLLLGGFG